MKGPGDWSQGLNTATLAAGAIHKQHESDQESGC